MRVNGHAGAVTGRVEKLYDKFELTAGQRGVRVYTGNPELFYIFYTLLGGTRRFITVVNDENGRGFCFFAESCFRKMKMTKTRIYYSYVRFVKVQSIIKKRKKKVDELLYTSIFQQ